MANEGIMALPQGMDMQGAEPQTQQPTVSSADSYDAAQTALGMSSPGDQEVLKAAIRENLTDEQLSPQELRTFILTFEELSQNPGGYKQARQQLIDNDFVDPEDLPEEYELAISRLAARGAAKLLQKDQAQAAQQQAAAEAQNPLTQIQMQELQIKQAEVERKKQKDVMDAAAKADQIEVEKLRITTQADLEGAQLGTQIARAKDEKASKDQAEGIKLGLQMGQVMKESKQPKKENK